jgi:peptide/nickel transport system ATP-binding protein
MENLLEIHDLKTNFYTFEGTVYALNGVSVSVRRGETFGLVGESGCGKSVTVRSILQIVQAPGRIEGGSILFRLDGGKAEKTVDLLSRGETYLRSVRGNNISMIFQEASTSLNPVFTIEEQIGESFYFHRLPEIIEITLMRLRNNMEEASSLKRFRLAAAVQLLEYELKLCEKPSMQLIKIDQELAALDGRETPEAEMRREELNRKRDAKTRGGIMLSFIRRCPLLRRYRTHIAATVREAVVSLLTDLGVPNPANVISSYPHELSGGMQQRIVIAIALACQPQLLIADEPTSNLDVTIQAQILSLIKELKKTKISSVLFITHDLGVVAEVCDRVAVMYAGDVCEIAPVKQLFSRPLHPYTQGLIASVPGEEQEDELKPIPGTVPNLIHPPSGCRFHPRCPHAMDICSKEKPVMKEIDNDHCAACHLYSAVKDISQ